MSLLCFQHTCFVFAVFVCYLLLPDLRVLFFLRAPIVVAEPKENLQLFYYFIATCRRLSSRVTKKKWNEKKCVNRNRFEICVKLLNTKVTEKSRSIFILYIVIIRKSVRLVLQEKKNARVAKKERKKTQNAESLVTEESPKLIILLKIVHYLSQE